MSLAEHGNATDPQQYSYLTLGTIFWVTVMLIGTIFMNDHESLLNFSEFRIVGEVSRRDDLFDFDLSSKLQEMRSD